MLSIRTQKSLCWFLLSGCISSFGFYAGVITILLIERSSYLSAVLADSFMWPIGDVLLGAISFMWIRSLYRREPIKYKARFHFEIMDLLFVIIFYAVLALIWSNISKDDFVYVGLPSLITISVVLLIGLMFANCRAAPNRGIKYVAGIGFASLVLSRLVAGGFVVSMLSTIPFHERFNSTSWFQMIVGMVNDASIYYSSEFRIEFWFKAMCKIGLMCVPISLICNQIALRKFKDEF